MAKFCDPVEQRGKINIGNGGVRCNPWVGKVKQPIERDILGNERDLSVSPIRGGS
jgi:hypothetical protein